MDVWLLEFWEWPEELRLSDTEVGLSGSLIAPESGFLVSPGKRQEKSWSHRLGLGMRLRLPQYYQVGNDVRPGLL